MLPVLLLCDAATRVLGNCACVKNTAIDVHTSDVPLEGQITCPAVGANEQIIRCGHGVINRRTSRRSTRIYRHTIDVQPKARPIVDTPAA
jgi:hypothetical protein